MIRYPLAVENPSTGGCHMSGVNGIYARLYQPLRAPTTADVIPFQGPLRELEQEPTMREVEVLQLISDGLVNREIGQRLFLSEETVKSHVRHILAKLQARSRAHAVAVGFRRGIIG